MIFQQIAEAIAAAKQNDSQPTLIEIRTIIGYGSKVAGTNKVHGNPLGKEEAKATKEVYGWQYEEEFTVPAEVKAHFEQLKQKGEPKKKNGTICSLPIQRSILRKARSLSKSSTVPY